MDFCALTLAHRARWAAAIFRRAAADTIRVRVRFELGFVFPDLTRAQRARCSAAIRLRASLERLLCGDFSTVATRLVFAAASGLSAAMALSR